MARPRSTIGADRGLKGRMALTMFLLGLLYLALVFVLLAAGTGMLVMAGVLVALLLAQVFLSDKIALRAMGAKQVTPEEAPDLHAMIDRLCAQAELPKPKVAIADTQVPNAFAMGRSPKSAVVCATTGIMHTLEPDELEGVMAHELAHVKHRDVLVMTVASFFASLAAMIMHFGLFFGGGMRSRDSALPILVVMLVSFLVYVVSYFLMLALSRYREFGADRGAALMTGRPSALSSALRKISGAMESVPTPALRDAERMNAFFIVPTRVKGAIQTLFSTHPPMEKRIERLEALDLEFQRRGVPVLHQRPL